APRQESTAGTPTTVADLLTLYRERYVDVEPLKSRHTAKSQLRVLTSELGELPVRALERPEAIEDFNARCSGRAIATTNRYLARFRHVCNWAIRRDLPSARPFHRRGVRILTKNERRRDRRLGEAEEQQLFDACKHLDDLPRANAKLSWETAHDIRRPAKTGTTQSELARRFQIPQSLCCEIVSSELQLLAGHANITTTQRYMNARANSLAE